MSDLNSPEIHICPQKQQQVDAIHRLSSGGDSTYASGLALGTIDYIDYIDTTCDPVICPDGPTSVKRHRFSPMRLIGSVEYLDCPQADEVRVDLKSAKQRHNNTLHID